jgi:hypothetical protein
MSSKGSGRLVARVSQLFQPSLFAVVIGFVYTICFIGWSKLSVTNIAWLQTGSLTPPYWGGDTTDAYLGWAFLRLDPVWHFPLTFTEWLGWPLGLSVAYTDSIPLAAVIARLLSPILPTNFQYLGLWILVSLVSFIYFAIRLCMLVTTKFNLAALLGGLLLLLTPALTGRVPAHVPLASHFLVLMSLWLYFKHYPDNRWWRITLPQVGTVALAASINPYFVLMTSIIATVFFGRCVLEKRCTWRAAGVSIFVVAAGAVASLMLFGYFTGGEVANYAGLGYRFYSFNLLSPFNSMSYSRFVAPLPTATEGQIEGFNYLGLGVFLLLVLNLWSVPGNMPKLIARELGPIMLGSLLLTLLAASTLITIGPYILVDIHLPARVTQMLTVFRASGRLFLPVDYLIMMAAIYLTWHNFGGKWATALLALAVIVQFADLPPLRNSIWTRIEHQRSSPLTADVWKGLSSVASKLIVMPPWQCSVNQTPSRFGAQRQTPGGLDGFAIFGALAAAQGLKTNNFYVPRFGPKAENYYCKVMLDKVLHGEFESDAAYVVSDSLAKDIVMAWPSLINCERVDGFNLCQVNSKRPLTKRLLLFRRFRKAANFKTPGKTLSGSVHRDAALT